MLKTMACGVGAVLALLLLDLLFGKLTDRLNGKNPALRIGQTTRTTTTRAPRSGGSLPRSGGRYYGG